MTDLTSSQPQTIVFEGMTSISALIKASGESSDARKILKVYFNRDNIKSKRAQLDFLKAKSAALGFVLEAVDAETIDALTNGKTHGGFAAVCGERVFPALSAADTKKDGIYFILDGIEDPYNFGYTIRAVYAMGADGIILPPRNWMNASAVVCRSSAGCSELIHTYVDVPENAVEILKARGFRIACANIRDSVSLNDADLRAPIAFVIGGEKRGISRSLLELADLNIRIDYASEFGGSLPTATAAGLFAYEAAKTNGKFKDSGCKIS